MKRGENLVDLQGFDKMLDRTLVRRVVCVARLPRGNETYTFSSNLDHDQIRGQVVQKVEMQFGFRIDEDDVEVSEEG